MPGPGMEVAGHSGQVEEDDENSGWWLSGTNLLAKRGEVTSAKHEGRKADFPDLTELREEVNQTLSAIKLRASTWLMLFLPVKRASTRLMLYQQTSFSPRPGNEVC